MNIRIIIIFIFIIPILTYGQDEGGDNRRGQGQGGDRQWGQGQRQGQGQNGGRQWEQQNAGIGVVKGRIYDEETKKPLEYVSVVIYKVSDSSMVTGKVTNEKGAFVFDNLLFGRYFIKLNFIGYKAERITGVNISGKKQVCDIGEIKFVFARTKLKEVDIESDRPLVEYKLDKKVVNVENNPVTTGGTAVDVLLQIPSVTVDFNGNVSMRGNSNVTILIDGRQTLLSQDQLQEIPSSQIKSIEIVTNPSAKYNPDGMAGIIDIKMKEPKEKGFNAMGMVTIGTDDKYNGSFNFNWKIHKFNIFGSYDERSDHNKGQGDMYKTIEALGATTSTYESDNFYRYQNSNNFKLGTDYAFNDKNILRVSAMTRIPYNVNNQNSSANAYGDLSNVYYFYFPGQNKGTTHGLAGIFNLDYKKKYDKKDELLTADIIFNISNRTSNTLTDYKYYNPEYKMSDTIKKTNTTGNSNSTTIQLDYVDPIGEHSKIEAGAQSIIKNFYNKYLYYIDNSFDEFIDQPLMDNTFLYQMQIHSLYGMYSGEYNKYTFQFGLRAEEAITSGYLENTNSTIPQTYFNIYPSGNITRKIDETQSLRLSYSRRVNRPNPMSLNPFKNISDPTLIREGNPYLKPEYINSYELGYLKYIKKRNSINAEIFYKQINGVIKNIIDVINTNTLESTYQNLSSGVSYGVDLAGDIQIIKGWRASLSYSYFRTVINGNNVNTNLSNSNYSWVSKLNTLINLPQNFVIQAFANYRGEQVSPQGTTKPMYSIDIAAKKDIMNKKANIGLRLSDIFNTQHWITIITQPDLQSNSYRKRESRILYLTFTYKINNEVPNKKNGRRKEQQKDDRENDDEEINIEIL